MSYTLDLAIMFDPPKVDELKVDKIRSLPLLLVQASAKISDLTRCSHALTSKWTGALLFNINMLSTVAMLRLNSVYSTGRIALDFMLKMAAPPFCQRPLPGAILMLGNCILFRAHHPSIEMYAPPFIATVKKQNSSNR